MSGIELRTKKLFRGKKNLVISALDHVVEYGDQPGIETAAPAIKNCLETDALLLPRFMLKRNWDLLSGANAPAPVVRINWSASFYYPLEYREGYTTSAVQHQDFGDRMLATENGDVDGRDSVVGRHVHISTLRDEVLDHALVSCIHCGTEGRFAPWDVVIHITSGGEQCCDCWNAAGPG